MTARKHKSPYTYPHKSRAAKVEYLCGIGGYSSRWGTYPIEFVVGTYYADLSFDSLWPKALAQENSTVLPGTREHTLMTYCARQAYEQNEDNLYSDAIDDARMSLLESDAYTYLWDRPDHLGVALGLNGRGGKHLCIQKFLDMDFRGMRENDLRDTLMLQTHPRSLDSCTDSARLKKGYEWDASSEYVDLLYRYVRQCEIDFTSEKASKEVEYHAAYRLYENAEEMYQSMFGEGGGVEGGIQTAAAICLDALDALDVDRIRAFRMLCVAAGADVESLILQEE